MSQIVRRIIKSSKAPAAIGPYSQAVQVGNTLYLSGSVGFNPETGVLVEGGIEHEARQALKNIGAVLEEAGVSYGNVVKASVFLVDMQDFATLNKVYQEFFATNPPARSCYAVAGLPKNARVEIEVVAVVGQLVDA